ncbi:protein PTST [Salix suchowensis]|nr:protein PTST [Salix suchowensis]
MGKILAKGQDAINHSVDIIATGTITMNHSGNIDVEPEHKSGGQICMPTELPVDLSMEKALYDVEQPEEEFQIIVEDRLLSSSLSAFEQKDEETKCMVEDSNPGVLNVYPDLNSNEDTSMPFRMRRSALEQKKMSLSSGVSDSQYYPNVKNIPGLIDDNNSCMPANSSLVEKVAKFIENGDLDAIEVYGLIKEKESGQILVLEKENID